LADAKRKLAMGSSGAGGSCPVPEDVNGVKFLGLELHDIAAKDLKPIIDEYKQNLGSGVVAIAASFEGKVSLVVGVTADLTTKFNAVDLVRVGAEILGGKGGGGRPDMAQAGGADVAKIDAALKAIKGLI
jgi:alanyl-tRNA synthetase